METFASQEPSQYPEPLDVQASALGALEAPQRIAWAAERFGAAAVATSSVGADSVLLLHLIAQAAPTLPVYFINTGFLFAETLAFRARLERELGLRFVEHRPRVPRDAFLRTHGELYRTDPDRCCALNKVSVLERALEGVACWVTGIRRDQAATRADIAVLERLETGVVKLNPLFDWDRERVAAYTREHRLPQHPLLAQGYTSIGCEPCTVRPTDAANPRSGRWAGREKTECGLHTLHRGGPR